MNEEKKRFPEEEGEAEERRGFHWRRVFYHNPFVLLFSFFAAVVIWFVMAAGNEDAPYVIHDIPIEVKLSPAAEEAGLQVFNLSSTTADVAVSGSNIVTNKLTAENFSASVTLNPASTKLVTGNTLQKAVLDVKTEKKNVIADYSIAEVTPREVTVEYDRYAEVTFPIENNIKYSADPNYYAGLAALSEDSVIISGPESAVNKISRVSADYTVNEMLREDKVISACALTLYDQNDQKISDYTGLYLSMSVETVGVTIPVMSKKTVPLVVNTINGPKNFSSSRITIEPAEISVAGSAEVLKGIDEIALSHAIDFSELSPYGQKEFQLEIPIPTGVRDITNLGAGNMSTAKVTVNLNGYEEVDVITENITLSNVPAGKGKLVNLTTQSLQVSLVGAEAQVTKLTGESISCTADLSNFAGQTGSVAVPVSVTVSGVDSCWPVGSYTVYVNIAEEADTPVMAKAGGSSGSSESVAAAPQE